MKKDLFLTPAAVALGLAGFTLRNFLYRDYLEESGLLRSSSLSMALFGLAALAVIVFAVCVFGRDLRPVAVPGALTAVGEGVFALSLVTSAYLLPEGSLAVLEPVILPLGALAAAILFYGAICTLCGKEKPFLPYAVTTVYLCVYMLARYRMWSARPQIMDFAFDMLACVAVTLTAYHRCDSLCNVGRRKAVFFYSLCALTGCMTALAWGEAPWLYIGGILFAATSRERL